MNEAASHDTDGLRRVLAFVADLDKRGIAYRLSSARPEALMATLDIPGARWEVEFMEDGTIEIERFVSNGEILDESALTDLFREYGADVSTE
jgi:hypothetical protein